MCDVNFFRFERQEKQPQGRQPKEEPDEYETFAFINRPAAGVRLGSAQPGGSPELRRHPEPRHVRRSAYPGPAPDRRQPHGADGHPRGREPGGLRREMRHRAGSGRVLGGHPGRQGVHLQPAQGRQVPQRRGTDGRGRQEELRALPGQGDQVPPARQLQLHQGHGGPRQAPDQVHPRQAGCRIPREIPSAGGVHHPLGQLRIQAAETYRHGRVRVRGMEAQTVRQGETVQGLLEEGRQGESASLRRRGHPEAHHRCHRAIHGAENRRRRLGLDGAVRAVASDSGQTAEGHHAFLQARRALVLPEPQPVQGSPQGHPPASGPRLRHRQEGADGRHHLGYRDAGGTGLLSGLHVVLQGRRGPLQRGKSGEGQGVDEGGRIREGRRPRHHRPQRNRHPEPGHAGAGAAQEGRHQPEVPGDGPRRAPQTAGQGRVRREPRPSHLRPGPRRPVLPVLPQGSAEQLRQMGQCRVQCARG